MRPVVLLAILLLTWYFLSGDDDYLAEHGEHFDTFIETERGSGSFDFRGYTITPLQSFSIQARVLSRHEYHSGREAELSHLDLALGWGPMSEPSVLKHIKIWQNNRWYFWSSTELPIPKRDVTSHSANMHMIPGNKTAFEALNTAREGDIIQLDGYLVRADAPDGWNWISSLSRHDTGDGSCEVVYVQSFKVLN